MFSYKNMNERKSTIFEEILNIPQGRHHPFFKEMEGEKEKKDQNNGCCNFRFFLPFENWILNIFYFYIKWYQKISNDLLIKKLNQVSSLNHLNQWNW